jgi:hypothetical protein
MAVPSILVSTWDAGVFCVTGKSVRHEISKQTVRSLVADGRGGVLAIVGGNSLRRRGADGAWEAVVESKLKLACCVPVGEVIFVGTDDAQVLRIGRDGTLELLRGFDDVAGRETWFAGGATINGKRVGPPLGVRSMAATCDGALLVNVHVGGIPRSTDFGVTWRPTIEVESDVHQVCAHPARPEIVIAASAVGFCVSRDGGVTWEMEQRGLHAAHCSAVAFGRKDVFVSASTSPFAAEGAVYRRPIDGDGPLEVLGGGMPTWLDGKCDTDCIAVKDSAVALVDWSGRLYVSEDDGDTWATAEVERMPGPSAVHIV